MSLPPSRTARARLRAAFAIEPSVARRLDPALEQTLLLITIDRRRTAGLGSCPDGPTPMCIVWESVMLDQAGCRPGHRLTAQGGRF